ncbi:DUF2259 domain-containing protein [Devosia sp.]|uniref:DUF2259 domain-containing protein n=1 Tax=Devosia sp. TaxID=1871048 RepID=UPI0035B0F6F5
MRPIAAAAASALLAASLVQVSPAAAGSAAAFNPLGFSGDGRYFAFEEFGVADGSGFPFASIYVIDLAEDRWAGAPVRVTLEDETAPVGSARMEALAQAGPALEARQLTAPALTVALHGDGEPVGEGGSLTFGRPGYGLEGPQDLATLTLVATLPPYVGPCVTEYGFDPPVGYRLVLSASAGETVLHDDESVPASRGCTVAYRLYGVFAPAGWGWNDAPAVVVLSVFTQGFEGPDRRFVALPLPGHP